MENRSGRKLVWAILIIFGALLIFLRVNQTQEFNSNLNLKTRTQDSQESSSQNLNALVTREPSNAADKPKVQKSIAPSGKYTPLAISNFQKFTEPKWIEVYPKLSLDSSPFSIVKNIHGSLFQLNHLHEIGSTNGIYFYENVNHSEVENTILDSKTDKVGVWSGEISISGKEPIIEMILKGFDMTLITKEYGKAIFKAGSKFSLEEEYSSLINLAGEGNVQLDIRFAKAVHQ